MAKKHTYEDVIKKMADNYKSIECMIANQLVVDVPNHYPTEGTYRETIWKSLFDMVVPKKYCIEQGVFIIDAFGGKSNEVDLAIFDELYTPYIFNYGKIKYIPIEAVAAVIQCKSIRIPSNIKEWVTSIDGMKTARDSVARMAGYMADNTIVDISKPVTQTATRPIKILCSLSSEKTLNNYRNHFDIMLSVDKKKKKMFKIIRQEEENLVYWNDSLNHVGYKENSKVTEQPNRAKILNKREKFLWDLQIERKNEEGVAEENVLLSLIFQLNQLLMVINNPMLFPHRAYANRFNKILGDFTTAKGEENGQQKQ